MMVAPITFGLLIYTGTSIPKNPHLTFFIAFFFSTLLAISTVIYLKKQGIVSDVDVSIRVQGFQPQVYGMIYCWVRFLLLK
jgi:hypothetical protein